MKVPPLASIHSIADMWKQIADLWPSFFALCLSFLIILISWLGHHNILRALDKTSPNFQLANGFFLFTVIFIPFAAAFMAEYLDTAYAQPAIVLYCVASTLHSLGWNALHRYIARPVLLVRASIGEDRMKRYARSALFGLIINIAITVLAWWFPYFAIVVSLLIWVYWLIISVAAMNEGDF